MRIGCCSLFVVPDGTGVEIIEDLAEIGYDYIELPLTKIAGLNDKDFENLCRRMERSGLPCKACNCFLPPTIRITGMDGNLERALAYSEKALQRASLLGVETVVLGSGGSRNVPDGFSREVAWRQMAAYCVCLDPIAEKHRITIAVEHLNRRECNFINSFEEGLALVREVDCPHIRMLVDYYHLMVEKEEMEIVRSAAAEVAHIHFAEPEGRSFPISATDAYSRFFAMLGEIGYQGTLSVEAVPDDFSVDASAALKTLRELSTRKLSI